MPSRLALDAAGSHRKMSRLSGSCGGSRSILEYQSLANRWIFPGFNRKLEKFQPAIQYLRPASEITPQDWIWSLLIEEMVMAAHVPYQGRQQQPIFIGFEKPRRKNRLGLAGFLFSLLGVFTLGAAAPIGLLLSGLALFRRPRKLAFAGTVLGLAGTGFLATMISAGARAHHEPMVRHQNQQTRQVIEQANSALQNAIGQNSGQLPEGIEGNIIAIRFKDVWNQELRYEPSDTGYTIRSAGRDREFGNRDDVMIRYEVKSVPVSAPASTTAESEIQI
jgi:hypothetical protein